MQPIVEIDASASPPAIGTSPAAGVSLATGATPQAGAPWLLLAGDALATARALRPGVFDLLYLDPPFFTGRRRAVAGGASFADDRCAGPEGYLDWLRPRLVAQRELLAPTGSLFVHLDWHAVHAVKLELDRIFGPRGFVNEIIWSYRTGGTSRRHLARKHDTILFYARTPAYKFHSLRERSRLAHAYGFANAGVLADEQGPYRLALMRDVWEIPALRGNMPERVAFPTQKPLALLARIVALVTDPGDLVGDLCCGSGTALVAAITAGRRAIGGDRSSGALRLAARRLEEATRCAHTPA